MRGAHHNLTRLRIGVTVKGSQDPRIASKGGDVLVRLHPPNHTIPPLSLLRTATEVPPEILVLNRDVVASVTHRQTQELFSIRDHLKVVTEDGDTGKRGQRNRDCKQLCPKTGLIQPRQESGPDHLILPVTMCKDNGATCYTEHRIPW